LLPWLFGGEQRAVDDTENNDASEAEHTTVPDNSPFGVENNGNEPVHTTRDAPSESAIAPAPAFVVPEERPASAPPAETKKPSSDEKGEALSPEFWDKLMKKAPALDKVKVEYDYPQ
jgi:hypothetical protein